MKQLARGVAATGRAASAAGGAAAANASDDVEHAEAESQLRANRLPAVAAVTAVGYYLGSMFGLELQTTPSAVSSLWPSNAFLLGVLLLTSRRHWWIVLVAALPPHFLAHGPSGILLPITLIQVVPSPARLSKLTTAGSGRETTRREARDSRSTFR